VLRLLVTANVVPSSLILVTLMMEAIPSSETSVLPRGTRRNIPEDGIRLFNGCGVHGMVLVEERMANKSKCFVIQFESCC
jgi:hypothetical protein